MQNTPSAERIQELRQQQQQALDALVGLARTRQGSGLTTWNDPETVQAIIDDAGRQAELDSESGDDELMLMFEVISRQYAGLVQLYVEQSDIASEAMSPHEAIGSHLELMYCLEVLFLAYLAPVRYQLDLMPGFGEGYEKLREQANTAIEGFQAFVQVMRAQHDGLYEAAFQS